MAEVDQILVKNKFDLEKADKILKYLTEIMRSVLHNKFESKGYSQKTIEQKFTVIGTGSWNLNTCISSSDVDALCILSKDILEDDIISEMKQNKCIKYIEKKSDKAVHLHKLKMYNTEVDFVLCMVNDEIIPTAVTSAMLNFEDTKSLTAFKALKLKDVRMKSVADWKNFIDAVKLIKIWAIGEFKIILC